VITSHGKVKTLCIRIPPTFEFAHASPVNVCGIGILFIAGDHAALAADTPRHVEMKAILFARVEGTLGNSGLGWTRGDFVEGNLSAI
jgi:hypothetical protein